MTPQEFEKALTAKAREIQTYANTQFPSIAGNITLRFIDGNFRAGGFQAGTFKRWKRGKGTPLIKTGALRAANYYTTQPGQVTIKNNMPYARVHNEGFKGAITIKAHTRNTYGKTKVGTGRFTKTGKERQQTLTVKTGEHKVRSHIRQVNIPQRQFMPISPTDSPVLNNAIQRQVSRDLQQIILK